MNVSFAAMSFPVIEMDYTSYYVNARTILGARFYSEPLILSEAFERFDEYKGMVDYFGGGSVELIAEANEAVLTIKSAKI